MLGRRSLLRAFASSNNASLTAGVEDLDRKIENVLSKVEPSEAKDILQTRQKTLEERLAELDLSITKIEALREAGRPEEIRIKNLPNKYGRVGRFAAYPWFGKYVEDQDKYPHTADRLGKYSQAIPNQEESIYKWTNVESDFNNPIYKSNFVQEPTREPDPDVNFEKGEILYDNPDSAQGAVLSRQLGYTGLFYLAFNMIHGAMSGRFIFPIGDTFMDYRADSLDLTGNFLLVATGIGNQYTGIGNVAMILFVLPLFPMMVGGYIYGINLITDNYVTKMRFNATGDILFISKTVGAFSPKEVEEAHEVSHLQVLPPTPITGYEHVIDRTWVTLTDMSTQENFLLCLNDKYWHPELVKDFKAHIHSLWD